MTTQIERIVLTKSGKLLYTIFLDDGTKREMREESLLRFGLTLGSKIDAKLESKIKQYEQEINCKEQAYRYLARRPHLERELANKLRNKGHSAHLIGKTIRYLKGKNLLNDSDFINRFSSEEKNLRHSGPLRIKKKLLARGASIEAVDEWVRRFYPEEEQIQHARILAEKKYSLLQNYPKQIIIRKIRSYLQQKGYTWHIIKEAVASWIEDDDYS